MTIKMVASTDSPKRAFAILADDGAIPSSSTPATPDIRRDMTVCTQQYTKKDPNDNAAPTKCTARTWSSSS
eukprot:CAMPEP_0206288610 /NCGR_PEP_ID=MMETSP0106_2-20121207/1702_1 /ASSEMBLY_ACC=CAM_ASM_000206 /TAXON_ID=81532 /ORGANISM="Acanthoeca-like sp., Strain 10tr" /LENGTH=70 /DNA_ID=CAMNT_0053719163 /DNA_START=199 /DNA_END=411 /DNA_ORIENTATION=-